jgi:hypothetical protein
MGEWPSCGQITNMTNVVYPTYDASKIEVVHQEAAWLALNFVAFLPNHYRLRQRKSDRSDT